MRAHRSESLAKVGGRVGTELGLGEREFVGGDADALVGGDQGGSGPLRQVGVLRLELLLFFALARRVRAALLRSTRDFAPSRFRSTR
ncbi:hypothetical protein [Agromyces sp. Marseille-P2726]|uniref:hypothetical protein n=1 Tax=Agromyces sp. Marseille-P2726 TaxID=2709132 RepID=UPI0020C381D7|nr:hypothetical protein [Agromyces sp. Marseille-P2726]